MGNLPEYRSFITRNVKMIILLSTGRASAPVQNTYKPSVFFGEG